MLLRSFTYADYLVSSLHYRQPHTTTKILDARKQINNQTRLLATFFSLSSHQTHIDKLESLRMEYYITTRLATRWWKRTERMDEIHKGRKRCTGRGERAMWTALFFPLGFDEIAHDLGYGKWQIETINNQTHLPATPLLSSFLLDLHQQARIVEDGILHYDKAGYKVVEKD